MAQSLSPNNGRFGDRGVNFAFGDQMQTKVNFFGESLEVPLSHSYSTQEDLSEARLMLKRWSDEWKEKKTSEMDIFIGRREIGINEGETASSVSATKVSHNTEKAQQLADDAQRKFGSGKDKRVSTAGRMVQFENMPASPTNREALRETGSD